MYLSTYSGLAWFSPIKAEISFPAIGSSPIRDLGFLYRIPSSDEVHYSLWGGGNVSIEYLSSHSLVDVVMNQIENGIEGK